MNTDKQLFQLFSACPNWLFELSGQKSPGASQLRSLTVKALERASDGLVVPRNDEQPLTVVEFQFRRDDKIYHRIVQEMIAAQQLYPGRLVRGMIFFDAKRYDPKTAPWTDIVESYQILDLLADFQRRHPQHPLTAVFQPFVEMDDEVLEKTAIEHGRTIKNSSLSARRKAILLAVFMDWLEQRFPQKTKQEIEDMLLGEFPPLEETQSGKDLIRIGQERGRAEGLAEGLAEGQKEEQVASILKLIGVRFRGAPATLKAQVERLTPKQREQCFEYVVNCESLAEVRSWLKRTEK